MKENKEIYEIPVTTDIPMLRDQTTYSFYIIRKAQKCDNAELRAVARLCDINYLEAKIKLADKMVFIAKGDAYAMKELKQKISGYEVICEITPLYQYG